MSMAESGLACDVHGLPLTNNHNARSSLNTFYIPQAGVCHGLAGFFEAHLFGNVMLSIFPDPIRASRDMLSWFPIFFPFRTPLYVPANSELDVHMWRLTDNKHVWYEWSAEAFMLLDTLHGQSSTTVLSPQGHALPMFQDESNHSDSLPPFTNAPHTPMMPFTGVMSPVMDNTSADASSSVHAPNTNGVSVAPNAAGRRIKVGQTDLMNPGACGSKSIIST